MKKTYKNILSRLFSIIVSAALVFLLASCADFNRNSGKKGSLSFSFGSSVIKAATKAARDVVTAEEGSTGVSSETETGSSSETEYEEEFDLPEGSTKLEIRVTLSGDYKASKTLDISNYMSMDLENEETVPDITESIVFDDITVGSTVTAKAGVYTVVKFPESYISKIREQYDEMLKLVNALSGMESDSDSDSTQMLEMLEYYKSILDKGGLDELLMEGVSEKVTIGSEENVAVIKLHMVESDDEELPLTFTISLDSGSSSLADASVKNVTIYYFDTAENLPAQILELAQDDFEKNVENILTYVNRGSVLLFTSNTQTTDSDGTITVSGESDFLKSGSKYCFFAIVSYDDGSYTFAHPGSGNAEEVSIDDCYVEINSESNEIELFATKFSSGSSASEPTTITLSYASGVTVPSDSVHTITFYGVPETALTDEQRSSLTAGSVDSVWIVELLNTTSAIYLGSYYGAGSSSGASSAMSVDSSTGAITIEASSSFTSKGESVYPVALIEYGSTSTSASIYTTTLSSFAFAYSAAASTILAEDDTVGFTNLTTGSIPCEVLFVDSSDTANETHTKLVSIDSYTQYSETMYETVKEAAALSISALTDAGYKLTENGISDGPSRYVSADSGYTGYPYVSIAYEAVTSTSSGITVTLASLDTEDKAVDVTIDQSITSDMVTLTATPASGVTVTSYTWIVTYGDQTIEGNADAGSWTVSAGDLGAGVYNVTLTVYIDGDPYSGTTTFTVQ